MLDTKKFILTHLNKVSQILEMTGTLQEPSVKSDAILYVITKAGISSLAHQS